MLDVVVHVPIEELEDRIEQNRTGAQAEVLDVILQPNVLRIVTQEQHHTAIKRRKRNQNGNHPNTLEEFIILENDLYTLYDVALNKYSILIDVYYRTIEHKLPTKQDFISYNSFRDR
jgi:hypothetical protein